MLPEFRIVLRDLAELVQRTAAYHERARSRTPRPEVGPSRFQIYRLAHANDSAPRDVEQMHRFLEREPVFGIVQGCGTCAFDPYQWLNGWCARARSVARWRSEYRGNFHNAIV